MNVLLAQALAAPLATIAGNRRVDFMDSLTAAQAKGATGVVFPIIRKLATKNLVRAVRSRHEKESWTVISRLVSRAETRLGDFIEVLDAVDPVIPAGEIERARVVFAGSPRKMTTTIPDDHGGRKPKNPIPEDEDLEILVKAGNLDGGQSFIFSMDEHFWGYEDLIGKTWGHVVIDPRQRPFIADEWRS